MSGVLQEIIDLLVAGLSNMATGLAGGLKAFIEGIFVNVPTSGTPSLTTFGAVIIIFAGISLAVGLSRWVINFCTSLGTRNR